MDQVVTVSAGEVDIEILPLLDEACRTAVVERFLAVIDEINRRSSHLERWWYTWVSCRDRINSRLLDRMALVERVALAAQRGTLFEISAPDPALGFTFRDRLKSVGVEVHIPLSTRARWVVAGALARGRRVLACVEVVGRVGVAALRARRFPIPQLTGTTVVMVTIPPPAPPPDGDPWRDAYFGNLPDQLRARGESVVVATHLRGTSRSLLRWRGPAGDPPVVPLAGFLGPRSIGALALALSPLGVRVHRGAEERLVRAAVADEAPSVALGLLMRQATEALLRRCPAARVLTLYENNPWERAVVLAARSDGDHTVKGYLHCAVVPAHLKLRVAPGEQAWAPLPDSVICTGPAAREALLVLSGLEPESVMAGCALRGPDLASIPRRPHAPATVRKVLVLLEALPTMTPMLQLVRRAAELAPDLEFHVRAHPGLPLAEVARRAGVAVGPGIALQPSGHADLAADLAEADAVVYKASSAVFVAAWMGLPLVHVDTGEIVDDDPLFDRPELKRVARTDAELVAACRAFSGMEPQEFEDQATALARYVERYLATLSDSTLAPFFDT